MMLHEALDAAVKERLIAKNPTNGTTVPKCNYPEKQILGDNQLETFLEAIKRHEYWCDFFYVEVMTGLRRGEICGLRWQDINFEENKLQVKRSVSVKKGGGVSIGETKTETGVRCIQMPPSVAELLKSKKQTAITEWVFPHFLHPEQPISPASAYRKLKVILKNAELPLIRFHDLRHTFATHATQGGVDPKTLSGILGHTNASFTLDTYTHVTTDMQKKASAVVGNMMKNMKIGE
jgi:integrase